MWRSGEPALEVAGRIGRGDTGRRPAVDLQPEVRAGQFAVELLGKVLDARPQARPHPIPLVRADLPEPPPLQGAQHEQEYGEHAGQDQRPRQAEPDTHEENLASGEGPDVAGAADFTLLTPAA